MFNTNKATINLVINLIEKIINTVITAKAITFYYMHICIWIQKSVAKETIYVQTPAACIRTELQATHLKMLRYISVLYIFAKNPIAYKYNTNVRTLRIVKTWYKCFSPCLQGFSMATVMVSFLLTHRHCHWKNTFNFHTLILIYNNNRMMFHFDSTYISGMSVAVIERNTDSRIYEQRRLSLSLSHTRTHSSLFHSIV